MWSKSIATWQPRCAGQYAGQPALRVHEADALEFDYGALARERARPLRVVGNLPYNISTPLLFRLLAYSDIDT